MESEKGVSACIVYLALLHVQYAIYIATYDCDFEKGGSTEPTRSATASGRNPTEVSNRRRPMSNGNVEVVVENSLMTLRNMAIVR